MAVYGVISIRNTNKKLSYRLQIAREQRPIPQKIAKLIYRNAPAVGGGDAVGISQRRLVLGKLEWLDYHVVKKV